MRHRDSHEPSIIWKYTADKQINQTIYKYFVT